MVRAIGAVVTLLELTSEGEVTSSSESERGYEAIGRHFPPDPNEEWVSELIIIRSNARTVEDTEFRRKAAAVLAAVQLSGVVHNATSYVDGDRSLVSPSRHATLIPIGCRGTVRKAPAGSRRS